MQTHCGEQMAPLKTLDFGCLAPIGPWHLCDLSRQTLATLRFTNLIATQRQASSGALVHGTGYIACLDSSVCFDRRLRQQFSKSVNSLRCETSIVKFNMRYVSASSQLEYDFIAEPRTMQFGKHNLSLVVCFYQYAQVRKFPFIISEDSISL